MCAGPTQSRGANIAPPRSRRFDCHFHCIRRLSLHIAGDVRVQIKRHRDIGVSQPFLHDLAVNTLGVQERCVHMAHTMKPAYIRGFPGLTSLV